MAKKTWTDEERRELMEKMDKDLDDFLQEKMKANEGKPQENMYDGKTIDEIAEEMKAHPAFMTEFDPTKPMSPAMQGLQQLKYESEDPCSNAESFKEDGNFNFKYKKYRWAIENYTKGIQEKCPDRELNAILYSNRAAAQFHIGNNRSSFIDCIFARKFKPDHVKAILRGVQTCVEMRQYKDAMKWCDDGLLLDPQDERFLEFRNKADKLHREQERDHRKEKMRQRKQEDQQLRLIKTIKGRGVQLAGVNGRISTDDEDSSLLSSVESHHPSGAMVHVDDDGALHWPVMFVYPEYGQTDFIENFNENSSFADHILLMFGENAGSPPWDDQNKYKPGAIEVYFEDRDEEKLYKLNQECSLSDALKHSRYVVNGGTPSFILIVKKSAFEKVFHSRYKYQ